MTLTGELWKLWDTQKELKERSFGQCKIMLPVMKQVVCGPLALDKCDTQEASRKMAQHGQTCLGRAQGTFLQSR